MPCRSAKDIKRNAVLRLIRCKSFSTSPWHYNRSVNLDSYIHSHVLLVNIEHVEIAMILTNHAYASLGVPTQCYIPLTTLYTVPISKCSVLYYEWMSLFDRLWTRAGGNDSNGPCISLSAVLWFPLWATILSIKLLTTIIPFPYLQRPWD